LDGGLSSRVDPTFDGSVGKTLGGESRVSFPGSGTHGTELSDCGGFVNGGLGRGATVLLGLLGDLTGKGVGVVDGSEVGVVNSVPGTDRSGVGSRNTTGGNGSSCVSCRVRSGDSLKGGVSSGIGSYSLGIKLGTIDGF